MLGLINPLGLNSRGEAVAALHQSLGNLGYAIPRHELDEQVFGVGTQQALKMMQTKYSIRKTGVLDDRTRGVLERAVAVAETKEHHLEGCILFENGPPAGEATMRLYHHGFNEKKMRFAETEADGQGLMISTVVFTASSISGTIKKFAEYRK
jgi:hypothetical protein